MNRRYNSRKKLFLVLFAYNEYISEREEEKLKIRSKNRRYWVKKWLLNRESKGAYHNILQELRSDDPYHFRKYLRMNSTTFAELVEKVGPIIQKETTHMRKPISPEEKLAVVLRYLATGETMESLMYQYRIHRSTISQFIQPVCEAIYQVLSPDYMKIPSSVEEWGNLIELTTSRWQYPNCFAAADGKHVGLIHPAHSSSEFYNYKGFYSIVLLAFVDYDYKFLMVDGGSQGRISDGGVFRNSQIYEAILTNTLHLPPDRPLPKSTEPYWQNYEEKAVPICFVGDDAFPLSTRCMKPFSKKTLCDAERIFNYRLSRFRRCSENAFGIWINRFRLFSTRASLTPEKATITVMASLVLHNLLRTKSAESYTPPGFIDEELHNGEMIPGDWRSGVNASNVTDIRFANTGRSSINAAEMRNTYMEHFMGPGAIPWQWNILYK